MKKAVDPQPGDIVWAWVIPRRGDTKYRPLVVLATEGTQAVLACVSTNPGDLPSPDNIEIPSHAQKRLKSKLAERSWCCVRWILELPIADLDTEDGQCPPFVWKRIDARVAQIEKELPTDD